MPLKRKCSACKPKYGDCKVHSRLFNREAVGMQPFHWILSGMDGIHHPPERRVFYAEHAAQSEFVPDDDAARLDHLNLLIHGINGIGRSVRYAGHAGAVCRPGFLTGRFCLSYRRPRLYPDYSSARSANSGRTRLA